MALPGRKSLRQFQCNEMLWVTFRRMAEDQEKEIDDVIGEAMEAYAQLSGYQTGINALSEGEATPPPDAETPLSPEPAFEPAFEPALEAARAHRPERSPERASWTARDEAGAQSPAPVPRRPSVPPGMPPLPPPPPAMPPPARSRFSQRVPQPSGLHMLDGPATPPPHPHIAAQVAFDAEPAVAPAPPPLYLVFDNQKYRIDKDQFIIGRGSKSSDLPIKDGNISRKHAAVIRRNGTYFIKDLGSTNGIDFKGMRIDNKRIEEGDVFHLCDYELRFTFKR